MKKSVIVTIVVSVFVTLFLVAYLFTGIFVIQPLGMLPEGSTVWYIRSGLKLPFIASADGLLLEKQNGVSLLGRSIMISTVLSLIKNKIILKMPYMKSFYLISTKGAEFEN